MNDFTSVYSKTINLDPNKRVKYTHGLVLGQAEFLQEEYYLLEKNHLHNRSLHGYGTVCGLDIKLEDTDDNGPKLLIGAGIAVNPAGKEITVPQNQCAYLDHWLTENKARLPALVASPPTGIELFIKLCYRECETDKVPIPSGPCQSFEETTAASRIADDFYLSLELEAPDQTEDVFIHKLLELLQEIPVNNDPNPLSREELREIVRILVVSDESPPSSPPAASLGHMNPDQVQEYMDIAFNTWITEVRPSLLDNAKNCVSGPPDENCVLIGRLVFQAQQLGPNVKVVGLVSDGAITIDESKRPYLLHTRLMQEYLRACCSKHGEMVSEHVTDLVHIADSQTITGHKTFSAPTTFNGPIALSGAGIVNKEINLPANMATRIGGTVTPFVQFNFIPAVRLRAGGEVAYYFSFPDDIQTNTRIRMRLIWGFQLGAAGPPIQMTWRCGYRHVAPNTLLPEANTPFSIFEINETEDRAMQNGFLRTNLRDLPTRPSSSEIGGNLRIQVSASTPANVNYFLLGVELFYRADKIGG